MNAKQVSRPVLSRKLLVGDCNFSYKMSFIVEDFHGTGKYVGIFLVTWHRI